MMYDKTHQSIYDRISKLEARIQKIEENVNFLGSAIVLLIRKVDPDFEAK